VIERDSELAEQVLRDDDRVDALELEADQLCVRLLATPLYEAHGLRLVVTAIKITPILERIADHACNIARGDLPERRTATEIGRARARRTGYNAQAARLMSPAKRGGGANCRSGCRNARRTPNLWPPPWKPWPMPQKFEDTMERLPIKFKRLHPAAALPMPATPLAAGADLSCVEAFTLAPGERRLVPTGLAVEIPPGFYGRVAPRSGLAVRHGVDTLAGVIDSDYRLELRVVLINLGSEPVHFESGARIAQLIIEQAAICDYAWAEELSETERVGGFGSTGS